MQVATIVSVSKALQDAGVRFLVCGGQAVVAHGYVRFTADLDIAIQLNAVTIRTAVNALGKVGYRPALPVSAEQFADAAVRGQWAREKNMRVLNFVSETDRLGTIDIFIENPFDFDAEYRVADSFELLPGVRWHVLRIEALIDMKRGYRRYRSPHRTQTNEPRRGKTMKREKTEKSIADAVPGDGTYAGARKLYLERGLQITLIERLRAVESMARTAQWVQKASKARREAK